MLISIQTIACRQPVIGNDANSLIIEELGTRFSEEISVIQENVIKLVLSIAFLYAWELQPLWHWR